MKHLVESAVRKVAADRMGDQPQSRQDWIDRLCDALMSGSETSHKIVLGSMVSSGLSQEDILQSYIPEVARQIGEMWVNDKASFVDVTIGVGRLQRLYRDFGAARPGSWPTRSVPLGQSVLMVIPSFEKHTLGAFAAADQLRRHGLWVHLAISIEAAELVEVLLESRFSMIGLSLSTARSVDSAGKLTQYLRKSGLDMPPVVVGGRVVELLNDVAKRAGADYAVATVREAIDKCGLATVSSAPGDRVTC